MSSLNALTFQIDRLTKTKSKRETKHPISPKHFLLLIWEAPRRTAWLPQQTSKVSWRYIIISMFQMKGRNKGLELTKDSPQGTTGGETQGYKFQVQPAVVSNWSWMLWGWMNPSHWNCEINTETTPRNFFSYIGFPTKFPTISNKIPTLTFFLHSLFLTSYSG